MFGLLPRLGGSTLAALLLLGACVVASVWLGRRGPALRRWPRLAVNAGTAVLAVFAIAGFADADGQLGRNDSGYRPASVDAPYVRDIFVYDSEGRLVENARLFDQDGNPIRIGYPDCADGFVVPQPGAPTYPYCPEQAPYRAGPGAAPCRRRPAHPPSAHYPRRRRRPLPRARPHRPGRPPPAPLRRRARPPRPRRRSPPPDLCGTSHVGGARSSGRPDVPCCPAG
ncbi:hypothetical protein ACFY2R_17245 [Micromonospora olivasterospora]|uniref:Uncharacterized protein n=1 Tax=Micromonospora olivasterospora TaxID=1880 RepID=A0A562IBY9_MICOL|nr:hypothetical protein [Micromonospora olivasterospora]TWH68422.1 hypothetical protein JD77_03414 [Micromonospora olivasterospora]